VSEGGAALIGGRRGVMDRFGEVTCLGGAQGASLLGWWAISPVFGPEFLSI